MSNLKIGPYICYPEYPKFNTSLAKARDDTNNVGLNYRLYYDWKAYDKSILHIIEDFWLKFVRFNLTNLLPERMRKDPSQYRGINLGTFNGTHQKAWVRLGYPMYGIERDDVIDELHEYGMEGSQGDFYNLYSIGQKFDFAVLDRAVCTITDYKAIEKNNTSSRDYRDLFRSITSVLKDNGVLIGILYEYYSATVINELAKYGELKVWPTKWCLLSFRLEISKISTYIPKIEDVSILESKYYTRICDLNSEGIAGLFIPTNEVVITDSYGDVQSIEFAPESEHWNKLKL